MSSSTSRSGCSSAGRLRPRVKSGGPGAVLDDSIGIKVRTVCRTCHGMGMLHPTVGISYSRPQRCKLSTVPALHMQFVEAVWNPRSPLSEEGTPAVPSV